MLIICCVVTNVYAENSSAVNLSFNCGGEFRLNKGFNLYLQGQSNNNTRISALRMDITFDESELKFLDCNLTQEDENILVKAALISDNTVRIIYINDSGAKLSEEDKRIVNIRFKPIKEINGQQYSFKVHVLEVGNNNAKAVNASYSSEFIVAAPTKSGESATVISKSKTDVSADSSTSKSEKNNGSKNASGSSNAKEESDNLGTGEASDKDKSLTENDSEKDKTFTEREVNIEAQNHDNIFRNPFFCVIFGAVIVVAVIIIYKAANSGNTSKSTGKYEHKD